MITKRFILARCGNCVHYEQRQHNESFWIKSTFREHVRLRAFRCHVARDLDNVITHAEAFACPQFKDKETKT